MATRDPDLPELRGYLTRKLHKFSVFIITELAPNVEDEDRPIIMKYVSELDQATLEMVVSYITTALMPQEARLKEFIDEQLTLWKANKTTDTQKEDLFIQFKCLIACAKCFLDN